MATRVLMADVSGFVEQTLLEIRAGLEAANNAGISVEIPEKVSFALEIISDPQSMTQVTTTERTASETVPSETTVETVDGPEVTNEAAAVDSEVVDRTTEQDTTEGGGDTEVSVYDYDDFED